MALKLSYPEMMVLRERNVLGDSSLLAWARVTMM
jgi:hypothetical protein